MKKNHSNIDPFVFIGEKKLGRVICPDPWKSGARNTVG